MEDGLLDEARKQWSSVLREYPRRSIREFVCCRFELLQVLHVHTLHTHVHDGKELQGDLGLTPDCTNGEATVRSGRAG
jgi:hypothetical protein